MSRRPALGRAIAGAGVALALSACSTFGMPEGADRQGADIASLWRVLFVLSLIVAAVVYGLILWSVVRYRGRGREDLPDQFRENLPLEVIYTAIPIAIVVVLWVLSYRTEQRVLALTDRPDLTVEVEAFAWGWRFTYPESGITVTSDPQGAPPELVLPLGRTTRIRLTSVDVIHAFYVPDLLFKRDALPGRVQEFDLSPVRLGSFHGACAEYCGLDHAFMSFTVRVLTPEAFDAWAKRGDER